MVITTTKVKEYVKGKNLHISSDYLLGLESELIFIIDKSVQRAKDNDRKTVMSKDL